MILAGVLVVALASMAYVLYSQSKAGVAFKSDLETAKLENQEDTDDVESIKKDAEDTELGDLDKELDDIQKELETPD